METNGKLGVINSVQCAHAHDSWSPSAGAAEEQGGGAELNPGKLEGSKMAITH